MGTENNNLIGGEADALKDDDQEEGSLQEIAEGKTDDIESSSAEVDDDTESDADESEADESEEEDAADEAEEGASEEAAADEDEEGADDEIKVPEPKPLAFMPVPPTDGLEAKITELTEKRAALRKDYDEGKLSRAELDNQLDTINDDISDARTTLRSAETAVSWNRNLAAQAWRADIDAVIADAKETGLDIKRNPMLYAAWDARVKALAQDPEMIRRGDPYILRRAMRDVRQEAERAAEMLGFSRTNKAKAEDGKLKLVASDKQRKEAVKAAVDERRSKSAKVPRTTSLASISSTDNADTGGNEFAAVDKLSGMELETRLARMSPDAQERYLRGR